jgi:hypothetical protein
MHGNPVQRKLVHHPKDWPWSSWSYYEKGVDGLIRIDPVGEEKDSEQCGFAVKKKIKPRTLETHKGAAPKFVLAR